MATVSDLRRLVALVAEAADAALPLLGHRHPIAVSLFKAMRDAGLVELVKS